MSVSNLREQAIQFVANQVIPKLEGDAPYSDFDCAVDDFIREWRNLPERSPQHEPYVRLFVLDGTPKNYRERAKQFLCRAIAHLQNLQVFSFSQYQPSDYQVDKLIRAVQKLPSLPVGSVPYQGLFKAQNTVLPQFQGGTPTETQRAIAAECRRQGLSLPTQIAYLLATTEHETAGTWQPVREAFWLSEEWRKKNLRYYPYYGRGYVQITWEFNYRRYQDLLGLPLLKQPDLVMRPDVSLYILVHGSKHGVFTGLKIDDFINATKTDYFNARKVINGLDRADSIAELARQWEKKIPQ
jgi:hypothetical protein